MSPPNNTPGGTGGGQAGGGAGANPNSQPGRPTTPDFVMTEVKLLLGQLTTPETNVSFDTASRADADTIQNGIGRLPEVSWTWADKNARLQQPVDGSDVGRYGLQSDNQTVFRLVSTSPLNWQQVQDFTVATWTWRNQIARQAEVVEVGDVGKVGYQTDIDSFFRLDNATGPVWTPVADPNVTSGPFELSTGASDAVAYHDFYRLQIAFDDVWAELLDTSIGKMAQDFYATWNALMNAGIGSDNSEQYIQLETVQSNINNILGEIATFNNSQLPQQYSTPMTDAITSLISSVIQIQNTASDAFKSAFGLDMENIQAELKSAQDGLPALFSQGGSSTAVTNGLGTALQIVIGLINELPAGVKARIAAFNAITTQPIGGYEELEKFLNDVRTILDLPTIAPPSGSDSEAVDYESYFDSIALNVQGALDYVNSLKAAIQAGQSSDLVWDWSAAALVPYMANGIAAANSLKSNATPQFNQLYGPYVNTICNDLASAAGNNIYDSLDISHLNSGNVSTADSITSFQKSLGEAQTNLNNMRSAYKQNGSSGDETNSPASAATDLEFPELETLFSQLSNMLKERYRFDVFAPASINYGLLLNYRQRWQPQSYQVGNLAATIPLAPGETRKYSTKKVVKKSRSAKELNDSLFSNKTDQSQTWRADAEIFADANQSTAFTANASGGFKIGVYDVNADTHLTANQASTSKNTKRDMHECVFKSAQEFRDQHRLEVSTEESREDETTSSREIRNPNDELTVTYLFYELQRRYLVSESLYRATPVILVANDVPAPNEIDQAWLVRYDWVLKRVMLDDSFLPALAYLGSEFAGQESALIILEMQVQHQKNIVDQLSRQVQLANLAIDAATVGVTNAEAWSLNDQRNQENIAFVKGFFDPLGIGKAGSVDDGNSDRARIDFANEALQRAQAKANDLTSQMKTELTALQAAVDKYTAAATRHYAMEAQIDRLRLHVKDNIIYYMQAIWSHEPPDQRYFRLYNLDVPVFEGDGTVTVESLTRQTGRAPNLRTAFSGADTKNRTVSGPLPNPSLSEDTKKLHQVADIDGLIGFKGNYMIFPLIDFDNYMAWYLIHNYVEFDPTAGLMVSDPDPDSDTTLADLEAAMEAIAQDPTTFAQYESQFEEVMLRLLSDQTEQMVIVPSDQLYIEALPGTHPILEDFKLIHRALDVKKVQAEVRHAELENLRLAARLANGEYGDPDVEKKIVVEGGVPVTVSPGD